MLIIVAINKRAASSQLELERLMQQSQKEKSVVSHKVIADYGLMDRNYGKADKEATEIAWLKMEQLLQEDPSLIA